MFASFISFADHADLLIHDDSGEFLLRWSEVLPTRSLLDVPEESSGRLVPPFNPFPQVWNGPSEPPMERG
jgi:hypothetical protein